MQSSLYLYPDRAVAKGKRKCDNVYTSRKRSKKVGSISASHVAGTDVGVGGTAAGKVGDALTLDSSQNVNVEAIVRAEAEEDFPIGEVLVDNVEGCVDIGMVEGAAEAAEGTALIDHEAVDYVHNSTNEGGHGGRQSLCDVDVDAGAMVTDEKSDECVGKDAPEVATQSEEGGTYDGPMAAGVMLYTVRRMVRKLRPVRLHRCRHPRLSNALLMRSVHDGSATPSAVAVVVTTSEEDSSPPHLRLHMEDNPSMTTPPTCSPLENKGPPWPLYVGSAR
ncbi:hypothetical protein Cgig2_015771 [Carnegiea gigantea]|uniref:Uncharacterized protein n=1 Tax=Carnegiea gigantea TaxID=171969 RepID=A0A9Q1QI02_9CARY|nr:hypothetical protein Cgig2_015771 [Carnegiea gigantea]